GDGDSGVATAGGASAAKASASASKSLSSEDARLKFAQCMRQNGVDMPDPQPGSDFRMEARKNIDRAKMQAAMQKCRQHLQGAGGGVDPQDPEVRDALLKFAQCARQNGIDMPDPSPDGGGAEAILNLGRAELEKARKLCGKHLQAVREKAGR
ncbi:hypothetical protein ACFQ07_29980, partial [Actinomadura adrarensis]